MAKKQSGYGLNQPLQDIFPTPVVAQRAPATSDKRYEIGQLWVDQTTGQIYGLASVSNASATWSIMGPGASDVDTLTADSGGALSPTAGNITIAGGTNLTSVGSGSTITVNLDGSISLTAVTATTITGTTILGTTFDTNVAAAAVTLAGTTLAADGTDANIDINITPKGTGAVEVTGDVNVTGDLGFTGVLTVTGSLDVDNLNLNGNTISSTDTNGDINLSPDGNGTVVINTDLDVDNLNLNGNSIISTDTNGDINLTPDGAGTTTITTGGLLVSAGDIINTHSDAGTDVTVEVTNSDNTNAASRGGFEAAVGGTSAGDPYVNFLISGGQTFTMGIDNSTTNDDFVISDSAALGTTNRLVIDGSSGDTSVTGNLALSSVATQLQMNGGAVTDFIGQATMASGTITVANTNIAAGDRIFVTRNSINGSSALGIIITSISAATSFTITAVQPGTPASTETNDVSIVDYFIVRQS